MTHTVEVDGPALTKHYTSWSRDEPGREWAALTLLSAQVPDLVPTPLASNPKPWITMTVVPGEPLGGALTDEQLDAVCSALTTLWSVPAHDRPPIDTQALTDRVCGRGSG